jgi:hypothetical protein
MSPSGWHRPLAALLLTTLAAFSGAPARADVEPRIPLTDRLSFKSQGDMIKSLLSFRKLLHDVPYDLTYCAGLLSDDGWTGKAVRANPGVRDVLDELFTWRLSNPEKFESTCYLNSSWDFHDIIDLNHGACAGLTAMNWLANYLAMFDGDGMTFRTFHRGARLPKGYSRESFGALIARKAAEPMPTMDGMAATTKLVLDDDEARILEFYRPFIDRLFIERKPTVIPYFDDLTTMSAHPALKAYMQKLAIKAWYDVNVSFSSIWEILLTAARKSKRFQAHEVYTLDTRVQAYLRNRIQPIIFIHLPPISASDHKRIHILRVLSAEWMDDADTYVIKVADPNFNPPYHVQELRITSITRTPERVEAVYGPYASMQRDEKGVLINNLSDVEIYPAFDRMSADAMKAWGEWLDSEGGEVLSRLRQASEDKARRGRTLALPEPKPAKKPKKNRKDRKKH